MALIKILPMLFFGLAAFAADLTLISIPTPEIKGNVGSPMAVSVVARSESGLPLEYEWKKDGKILKGENSSAYTIPSAKLKDAGVYTVTVKNSLESKLVEAKVAISKTKLKAVRAPAAVVAPPVKCH